MDNIDFQHRTRLVFGNGTVERLGELAKELGVKKVLIVSDPGVVAAGHFQRGSESLAAAGLETHAFHGVHENPSTADVAKGVEVAKSFEPDMLIGLGGGSSMDCAKGINFVYSCGGKMEDYWGVGKATSEMLPMIAVPTTAGTGSEAQSFALISHAETHVKMACGDPRAACKIALLDPELTVTQPAMVTALTGIDAISHALESYVTKKRNALSTGYSRQAWKLLSESFQTVVQNPEDLVARGRMQLGAYFAGLAIETSMLGAAHALANPLTARFDIVHGQAVGMMLPPVIEFNGSECDAWYRDLWQDVAHTALARECAVGTDGNSQALAEYVRTLVSLAGLETDLQAIGVAEDSLKQLAQDATKQWTGTFNPIGMSQESFLSLYERTFQPQNAS